MDGNGVSPVWVLVAGNNAMVRRGRSDLLDRADGPKCAGVAAVGGAALRRLRASAPDVVPRSIQAGSHGVLVRSSDQDAIAEAVHAIATGTKVLSASPTEAVLGAMRVGSRDIRLTPREGDVLAVLCDGVDSTDELTSRLALSETTVKKQMGVLP